MISNDAIEAKLDHLRDVLEEVRAGQPLLHAKIEAVNTSLSAKIDTVNTTLSAKIDAVNKSLGEKIDKQSEQINALDKGLDRVNTIAKVVLALIGLCVSAAVILNTLRNFHVI